MVQWGIKDGAGNEVKVPGAFPTWVHPLYNSDLYNELMVTKAAESQQGRNTATYKFNDSCRDFAPPAQSVYHTNAISDCVGVLLFS